MKKLVMAVAALVGAGLAFAEKPYDFRKDLECVHEQNRRDLSLKPAADECAFADGAVIAIPADADEVLALAAKDFVDYLDVSMGVSARMERSGEAASRRFAGGGVRFVQSGETPLPPGVRIALRRLIISRFA